ncbi:hypothetical protein ACOBQJ_15485 [Pelotomaculum propionicicum]|uniref:hypothetical protein n=1 Tax=Pelotomaculum propionicicum TaxID=258475 RepID=UPI003B7FFB2F
MYKVACAVCGKISFTSVRVQWLTKPFCPYCGGALKQKEIQDNNDTLAKEVPPLSANSS